MSIYSFVFEVEGDAHARHWSLIKTIDADSLEQAVELTWEDGYKLALNRIWKTPVECAIFFEPRPNRIFKITARCGEEPLSEDLVLEAFFRKRVEEFRLLMPNWATIYSK